MAQPDSATRAAGHGQAVGLAADRVRRCVHVHHELGPTGGLQRDRAAGKPQVLADGDAHGHARHFVELEIASSPARTTALRRRPRSWGADACGTPRARPRRRTRPRRCGAGAAHPDGRFPGHGARTGRVRHGMIEILVPRHVDEPDERHTRRGGGGHLLQSGQVVRHEGRLQQQVLGGIAGDGELGEGCDVGAFGLDARQAVDDPRHVAFHFADDGVELAQRHTQVGHGKILSAPSAGPAWHAAVMAPPSPGAHRAGAGPPRPAPLPAALAR